jgi:GAF domain-containing protein
LSYVSADPFGAGDVSPPHTDSASVRESIAALRRSDLLSGELLASLHAVVDATRVVFGADGAGVMLLDDQQALHYVGATDGRAAAFEAAQEETGEGPCVDSLLYDMTVSTVDLATDPRWPQLTKQIGGLGVRGILGVPLHLGATTVGSLNAYYVAAHDWGDDHLAAMSAHARVVEELLGTAVLAQQRSVIVDQLNRALENRVTIERAIGVIMATSDLDPVRAFNELRRAARTQRRRVAELADEVLAARRFAPEVAPPATGTGPA